MVHRLVMLLLVAALLWPATVMAEDGRLSTHVLDIAKGQPAKGVPISLYKADGNTWTLVTTRATDDNGRVSGLLAGPENTAGTYKLHFATADYFKAASQPSIYPYIEVVFRIDEGKGHYHIPITVTANGYSTYRGS